MKTVDNALQSINDYLISITKDTVNGWYELEIGIPKGWVFDENDEINYKIIEKLDAGNIIRIIPKNNEVLIDDLIAFVEIIIETNKKIADKENEFTSRMEEMKKKLENEAKKFYEELDELKKNSFKKNNAKFVERKKEVKIKKTKNSSETNDENVGADKENTEITDAE